MLPHPALLVKIQWIMWKKRRKGETDAAADMLLTRYPNRFQRSAANANPMLHHFYLTFISVGLHIHVIPFEYR